MTLGQLIDAPTGAHFSYNGRVYKKHVRQGDPLDVKLWSVHEQGRGLDITDADVLAGLREFDDDSFTVQHERIEEISRWTLALSECLGKRIAEGKQSKTEDFHGFTLELFCDEGEPEWVIARLTGASCLSLADVDYLAELIGSSDPRVDVAEAVRTDTFAIQVELVMSQEECSYDPFGCDDE